jgi:hypothetical protein
MDYESTPDFDANFLKLTSKNKALELRLLKKIGQILNNRIRSLIEGSPPNKPLSAP